MIRATRSLPLPTPLVARRFDADYQVNAISGRGLVRNYDGFAPEAPMWDWGTTP